MKKILLNIIKLLSGGLLSSIGLLVIVSPKWSFLGKEESLFFIQYYQWELFGLTISKLGIDQVNYSLVIKNKCEQLDIKYYTLRNSFLAVFFCLFSYYYMPLPLNISVLLFFTIVFDLYSIISLSTFNALGKYNIILVSNILNYPTFFTILLIVHIFSIDITIINIATLFLLSSFIRASYLLFVSEKILNISSRRHHIIKYDSLGVQQILNYFLFKADQILITILNENSLLISIPSIIQNQIIFYGRIPEVYTSVSTGLSTLYIERVSKFMLGKNSLILIIIIAPIFMAFCIFIFYVYTNLMGNGSIGLDSFYYWMTYSLQLLLIIPANISTFILLQRESLNVINKSLFISIIITSIGIFLFTILSGNLGETIKYIVPVQLLIYIIICFKAFSK